MPAFATFKRVLAAYRRLLGIIGAEAPLMVGLTFAASLAVGLTKLLSIIVNQHLFDDGLALAQGAIDRAAYLPWLTAFILLAILPPMLSNVFIFGYVEARSLLIMRTAFRSRMLDKLAGMKYEHLENAATLEIIDKAYNRAEGSARHLFPMYVFSFISNITASVGVLIYLAAVRWWLPLAILVPAAAEIWYNAKHNQNIYLELESYWQRERSYGILGKCLRSRDTVKEMKLFGNAGHLIQTYRQRLHARNKEYEHFYFKHLRRHFLGQNITKLAKIGNVLLLLYLYLTGVLTVGIFIALTLKVLTDLFESLRSGAGVLTWSAYHINFFDYYDRYLNLPDEQDGSINELPAELTVEFRDVWFRYPGTERDILKGLNFTLQSGEKLSIVGENGEGKSTVVKLLLRLFTPDRGEIRLGGQPLANYSRQVLNLVFGPVFQDFTRYSISLRENIGAGSIGDLTDKQRLRQAAHLGKVDEFAGDLPHGYDTLLGRDFDGGVDLSGGQWQRVAIARAFMGDKPILLLDEPTSQLDPIAESQLYREFADMADGKTALFITHRLASTMITDRILVIRDGIVSQAGTHAQLMAEGGLYADMFNAQKHWYLQQAAAGSAVI